MEDKKKSKKVNKKKETFLEKLTRRMYLFYLFQLPFYEFFVPGNRLTDDAKYLRPSLKYSNYEFEDKINADEMMEVLDNSDNLNDEEKTVLINEDFINDVVDIVNDDEYARSALVRKYSCLDVEYDPDMTGRDGYVVGEGSIIYMADKELPETGKDSKYFFIRDVLPHEFVHINQYSMIRTLLNEATAEIYSSEYYNSFEQSYKREVSLTRILLETIGPKPINDCIFKGDTRAFFNAINPYVTEDESIFLYKLFLESYKDDTMTDELYNKALEVLNSLYKNKYNEDMYNNGFIDTYIINPDDYFVDTCRRFYFNDNYMDEEYSFYYEKDDIVLTIQDAIDNYYLIPITDNFNRERFSDIFLYNGVEYGAYRPGYEIKGDYLYCYCFRQVTEEPINEKFKDQFVKTR